VELQLQRPVGQLLVWQQPLVDAAQRLHSTEDFAAADFVDDDGTDTHDELAVEFSGLGTWLYNGDGSGTWTRLTATSADTMVPAKFGSNADWELIFADAGDTPWWYSGLAWERLTYSLMDRGFVVAFDPDAHTTGEAAGETELATDFGTLGVWQYNYSTNSGYVNQWTQLTASNPVFMIPPTITRTAIRPRSSSTSGRERACGATTESPEPGTR